MSVIMNFLEESENKFIFGVEAEGAGGDKQISDISSSLPGVCVEREQGVQFSDVVW